ncbi:uncharacterized protein BDR25DRAFT_356353 [Lindgomyces ingoldianus]|uniref:Uncharacterized protein n=1 Tax=Lindgomyces ingoldianus TaxID=673940 RepID=A0ACB6QRV2_9PLEO|nr:uncharacterized protein BDR25DRAFT_356353 [Lindgomyces ingoldianus]KAF2469620.1 hypothetical protein BDR25DRAFT_356353 [Lindgomyces ingoldianus]
MCQPAPRGTPIFTISYNLDTDIPDLVNVGYGRPPIPASVASVYLTRIRGIVASFSSIQWFSASRPARPYGYFTNNVRWVLIKIIARWNSKKCVSHLMALPFIPLQLLEIIRATTINMFFCGEEDDSLGLGLNTAVLIYRQGFLFLEVFERFEFELFRSDTLEARARAAKRCRCSIVDQTILGKTIAGISKYLETQDSYEAVIFVNCPWAVREYNSFDCTYFRLLLLYTGSKLNYGSTNYQICGMAHAQQGTKDLAAWENPLR